MLGAARTECLAAVQRRVASRVWARGQHTPRLGLLWAVLRRDRRQGGIERADRFRSVLRRSRRFQGLGGLLVRFVPMIFSPVVNSETFFSGRVTVRPAAVCFQVSCPS